MWAESPYGAHHSSSLYDLGNVLFYDLNGAIAFILGLLHKEHPLPSAPISTTKKTDRNTEIRALYSQGMSVPDLARKFGISEQRIHQILRGKRK